MIPVPTPRSHVLKAPANTAGWCATVFRRVLEVVPTKTNLFLAANSLVMLIIKPARLSIRTIARRPLFDTRLRLASCRMSSRYTL